MEQLQQKLTRQASGMGCLPYQEVLKHHGLPTLQARREKGDMMETFKILTGTASTRVTSEHNPARREEQLGIKRHQFSFRVVPEWFRLEQKLRKTQQF